MTEPSTGDEAAYTACRSDWYADTGHSYHPEMRIVRCNLPKDHYGDHDELVDGEAGVVSWPPTAPKQEDWPLAYTEAERDQLLAERDNALTEVARLQRELDEARALAATCSCGTSPMTYEGPEADCAVHGAIRALNELREEMQRQEDARVEADERYADASGQLDAARRSIEGLRNRMITAETIRDTLAARLERAEAECDAMRAVVEAAGVRAQVLRDGDQYGSGSPGWYDRDRGSDAALIAAVDTYRAATPSTPEAAP